MFCVGQRVHMCVAEPAHVLELAIIVHFPRISQCHLVDLCCKLSLFFLYSMSLEYSDTNQDWISGRYDGWNIFSRVITLVLWWPGNMMSCLAPLAGGPIIIISFARITIFPGGNYKTYSISCSWWVFCVSKSDLCFKTMPMLSRSMPAVLRFSARAFEAQC